MHANYVNKGLARNYSVQWICTDSTKRHRGWETMDISLSTGAIERHHQRDIGLVLRLHVTKRVRRDLYQYSAISFPLGNAGNSRPCVEFPISCQSSSANGKCHCSTNDLQHRYLPLLNHLNTKRASKARPRLDSASDQPSRCMCFGMHVLSPSSK